MEQFLNNWKNPEPRFNDEEEEEAREKEKKVTLSQFDELNLMKSCIHKLEQVDSNAPNDPIGTDNRTQSSHLSNVVTFWKIISNC